MVSDTGACRKRTGCLCEFRGPVIVDNEGRKGYRLRGLEAVSLLDFFEARRTSSGHLGEMTAEVSVLGEPGGQRLLPGALKDTLHHSKCVWSWHDPAQLAAALYSAVDTALASSGVILPPWLLRYPIDLS